MFPIGAGNPALGAPGGGASFQQSSTIATNYTQTGIPNFSGGYAYTPGSSMTVFMDGLNKQMAGICSSMQGLGQGQQQPGGFGQPQGLGGFGQPQGGDIFSGGGLAGLGGGFGQPQGLGGIGGGFGQPQQAGGGQSGGIIGWAQNLALQGQQRKQEEAQKKEEKDSLKLITQLLGKLGGAFRDSDVDEADDDDSVDNDNDNE